jgi:hypothetical protein
MPCCCYRGTGCVVEQAEPHALPDQGVMTRRADHSERVEDAGLHHGHRRGDRTSCRQEGDLVGSGGHHGVGIQYPSASGCHKPDVLDILTTVNPLQEVVVDWLRRDPLQRMCELATLDGVPDRR